MLNIKEQAEIYKIGLMIGYFKAVDVISWVDNIIANNKNPDSGIIEISLSGSKGINAVISQLDNIKGKTNNNVQVKTILGLLYKDLISKYDTVFEMARKLYVLSQYIPNNSLEDDEMLKLRAMEDIFHIYGAESVSVQISNLLKKYEIFADNFNTCCR